MMNRYIPGTKIPLMMSMGCIISNAKEHPIEELFTEPDVNTYKEKTFNRQAFREISIDKPPCQAIIINSTQTKVRVLNYLA